MFVVSKYYCFYFVYFLFFFLKVNPADGRDHGWEREQNHHLRGNQETMWWSHTQDETWWVSTWIWCEYTHAKEKLEPKLTYPAPVFCFWWWSCTVWFVRSLWCRIYIITMFILLLTKRFWGTGRSAPPFRDKEWIILLYMVIYMKNSLSPFLGGQRCAFTVTRASQRGTGSCQVQQTQWHLNSSIVMFTF